MSNSKTETNIVGGITQVQNIILVLSGKGGVGKSSVSTQLALSLATSGPYKVGILDLDLCGPSIPRMMGVDNSAKIFHSNLGWIPYELPNSPTGVAVKVMSLQFLLPNKDDAVIWRGPKKSAMIRQFIEDVDWSWCDFLVIDTPPGTSDEHIAIMETLQSFKKKGAVIVTTPQAVAISDVRKEINFCEKVQLPILGVIENMSGFVCPHCSDCTYIFSSGGGIKLAEELKLPFLGKIPIDPEFAEIVDTLPTLYKDLDQIKSLLDVYPKTNMAKSFSQVTDNVLLGYAKDFMD